MRTIIRLSLRGAAAFGWVFLAMLTCGPSHAFEKGEIILSKSTFIYLADPDTQALDSYNFAYLPAGTRLRYEGKSITEFGKRRFLVHSETGSYGYIREDQIWNLTASTTPTGKIGIFQRKYKHEGSVQNIMSFEIYFSRGEKYVVLDREIDSWLIQVDLNDKFTNDKGTPIFELTPGTRVTLNINVPTEYLTVIDFSKLGKTAASTIDGGSGLQPAAASSGQPGNADVVFPSLFRKSIIDGIAGIEKPCNTKNNRIIRTNVGGGLDIEKFFVSLGFSAKQETEEIEVFPETKNVTRTYYTRDGTGVYRLTQYKDCATGHYEYSFLKPGNDEVNITQTWAEQNSLGLDNATGKIKVTCPPQYFAFEDALIQQGFNRTESTFIISKIGRWRDLSDAGCS